MTQYHACYVTLEDGTCLFAITFTPMPDEVLISGMLAAMQAFIHEVSGSFAKKLATGGFVFHLEIIGRINIILATSDDERPTDKLNQLRTIFLHKYGSHLDDYVGITDHFMPFENEVRDVLDVHASAERIKPKEKLNSFALISIRPELQEISREMILLKEATAADFTDKINKTEFQISRLLEELLEIGYVGRYIKDDRFVYYI